jgi:hypothetical protein
MYYMIIVSSILFVSTLTSSCKKRNTSSSKKQVTMTENGGSTKTYYLSLSKKELCVNECSSSVSTVEKDTLEASCTILGGILLEKARTLKNGPQNWNDFLDAATSKNKESVSSTHSPEQSTVQSTVQFTEAAKFFDKNSKADIDGCLQSFNPTSKSSLALNSTKDFEVFAGSQDYQGIGTTTWNHKFLIIAAAYYENGKEVITPPLIYKITTDITRNPSKLTWTQKRVLDNGLSLPLASGVLTAHAVWTRTATAVEGREDEDAARKLPKDILLKLLKEYEGNVLDESNPASGILLGLAKEESVSISYVNR